jgi:hypothetical protein
MSARLRLYAGTAAVLAGAGLILLELGFFAAFGLIGEEADFAEVASRGWWPLFTGMGLLAGWLALLAVVGIYRQQAEESGGFGLFAAGLFTLALALFTGAMWLLTFAAPWLAAEAPHLLAEEAEGGFLDIGFMASFMGLSVGGVLFAISTWLAKVYPRWPAVLLILSSVLGVLPFDLPGSAVLAGVAFVGYGLALRRLVGPLAEAVPARDVAAP